MEISRELLSEVLDFNNEQKRCFKEYKLIGRNEISIYFFDADSTGKTGTHWWKKINIYELSYKCKEWAIGKYGFSLHSFPCPDDTYTCEIYKFHKSTGYVIVNWSNCLSENEAIFESCEWILKEEINK